MPCFHPIPAFRSSRCTHPDSGKPVLFFKESDVKAWPGYECLSVPCGQCIGCRLERSRQWAIRCVHEASLYDHNCFITLTFDSDNLNESGSLDKRDFVLFMKRLRFRFSEWKKIRYFHCGEYGEQFGRPHHHACLFNFDFPDKVFKRNAVDGSRVYTSKILSELWPYGFHEIGSVTFESAAYVARYILKKINGDQAQEHYLKCDEQGNFVEIEPEYVTMSRRPGVGRGWYEKFSSDVFPHDYVVLRNGVKCKPPKYYSRQFELTNPDEFSRLRLTKMEEAKANPHNSPERLLVREDVQLQTLKTLKRGYETK